MYGVICLPLAGMSVIKRRIKCADLDDLSILRFIHSCRSVGCNQYARFSEIAEVVSVIHCGLLNDSAVPFNLMRAKLKRLHKRELINGCCCGCNGDFWLTLKGRFLLIGEELELPKRFYQLSN